MENTVKTWKVTFEDLDTERVREEIFGDLTAAAARNSFNQCYRHGNYEIISVEEVKEENEMQEMMLEIIESHNEAVDAFQNCDIQVKYNDAFKIMSIMQKLTYEGCAIQKAAKAVGIRTLINSQNGKLTIVDPA